MNSNENFMNTSNATEKVPVPAEQKEIEKSSLENSEELTKGLAAESKFADADQARAQEDLKNVRESLGGEKAEKKASPEELKIKRQEAVKVMLQTMIDNIQKQVDGMTGPKKWINKMFDIDKEMVGQIQMLKALQEDNRDFISLETMFAGAGGASGSARFVEKNTQKEIYNMVATEVEPEEQKYFHNTKENEPKHSMTDVAQG